jgi:hypothetical protein
MSNFDARFELVTVTDCLEKDGDELTFIAIRDDGSRVVFTSERDLCARNMLLALSRGEQPQEFVTRDLRPYDGDTQRS